MELMVVVLLSGATAGLAALWHRHLVKPIAHIATGALRRALHPVEKPIGAGAKEILAAKDVAVRREFFTLAGGDRLFYQIVEPKGRPATHVVVFFHGYTSNSDLYLEVAQLFARQGAIVVLPDLPNHGRSDGLLLYIPDWWAFVSKIWEFLDSVVEPLRKQGKKPMKVFGSGASLGGGLAACLAIKRPEFFDGLALVAPLLFVADEIKPPPIVQKVFKQVLGPLQLTWPLTPTKSLQGFDFQVAAQGDAWDMASPFTMKGLKPRLATAKELGFTFPDWLEENMAKLRTPFIALHSKDDKVTDHRMTQRLYKEAASTDKKLQLYEGPYHCELMCCLPGNAKLIGMAFEPWQLEYTDRCFKDVFEWLAPRV